MVEHAVHCILQRLLRKVQGAQVLGSGVGVQGNQHLSDAYLLDACSALLAPAGPTGAKGDKGDRGTDGAAGELWLTKVAAPWRSNQHQVPERCDNTVQAGMPGGSCHNQWGQDSSLNLSTG